MKTIWGQIQHQHKLAGGVYEVDTASHGGIIVSTKVADRYLSHLAKEIAGEPKYGYYHFPNLTPGDYRIRLSVPEAHRLTGLQSAALGEIDSDADPDTAATALISLTTGEVRRNVDFGLVPLPKTP